ncbi:MAG: penicillin-binding protein 2 [Patescibacteria group bacterium]|jgi:cell division protein FtsI/penicillin-binding protein 2
MKPWKKNKNSRMNRPGKSGRAEKNNRANFLLAIIFLLAAGLLYKLFYLQVIRKDYYSALAAGQHEVFRELEPDRGRIFIEDTGENDGKELYPVATNKEFALFYAKPAEIPSNKTEDDARIIYDYFDRAKNEKETDKEIERLRKEFFLLHEKETEDKAALDEKIRMNEDFLRIKRDLLLEEREQAGIAGYVKILGKENDPYEPIKTKVDEEDLKNIYLALAKSEGLAIGRDGIKIKGNKIYFAGDSKELEFALPGFGHAMETFRYYPEGNMGANILGFVGYEGEKKEGRYGLEEYFNEELAGKPGSLKTERDATGDLIIINDRQFTRPEPGADMVLTIDRNIQFAACQKLNAAVSRHGADGGSVIILEPESGRVIAMCSSPDFDPNNYKEISNIKYYNNSGIFGLYEPGSIFKVITMAAGLDQEKITPETTYTDSGVVKIANYEIKNSDLKAHGECTMNKVLEQSLNTGVIYVMRKTGPEVFADYVRNFGFGERTGIELSAEGKGDIGNLSLKENEELYAATASFGQGISATPLQMVTAYAAIANGGILMKPYIVKEIIRPNGEKITAGAKEIRRVISERAAALLGGMMVNVVENGHGKMAGVKGYFVAGKTGTAQVPRSDGRGYETNSHVGSFAGFAPADEPKFVMIVKIDHPRDVEWAESSAAPLFGEIADYVLHYYKVPAEREVK